MRMLRATAVTHGLPLVTTRGPHSDADFVHGHNVLLCNPKDPRELGTSMMQLLSSPDLCAKLSKGARKLYEERFLWERVVEQTLKAFGGC